MSAAEKMPDLPSSRAEAARLGEQQYFTGKPCVHGHIANRFTSSGTCVECNAIRARKVAKEVRANSAAGYVRLPSQLANDPRIFTMARMLADNPATGSATGLANAPPTTMRTFTAGVLYRFAVYANQHAPDGILHDADLATLDFISETPGFGAAMAAVGWAIYNQDTRTVTLPPLNSAIKG